MSIGTKRLGAASLALLQLWSVAAYAQASCQISGGLGAVFTTLPGGSINLGSGDKCQIQFYGTSSVNTGSMTQPGTGSSDPTTKQCQSYTSQQASDSGKGSTSLTSSGTPQNGPTLPVFQESAETFGFQMSVNELIYQPVAGDWNGSQRVTFTNGVGTVVTATRTITITLNGSENGAHSYTFPGGDYGTFNMSNINSGQFQGVIFSGPIRARSIQGSGGNPSVPGLGGVPTGYAIGVTFAQDNASAASVYQQQNFINKMYLGDGVAVNVVGPGRTTINLLGKDTVASTQINGFQLGNSNSCVNFTYNECQHNPKSWADMDSQHPERLQFNLYYGDFKTADRQSFAAGIYVPEGSYVNTGASGTTIVGEILAKNIVLQQNNSGLQFFSKATTTSTLANSAYSLTPPVTDAVVNTGDMVYRAMQNDYRADGVTKGTSGHLKAFILNADSTQASAASWDAAEKMTVSDRAAKIVTEKSNWANSGNDFEAINPNSCVIDPTASTCRTANDPRDPTSLLGVPWRIQPLVVGDSVLFATDDGVLYSIDKKNGTLNWGWIPQQTLTIANATDAAITMAARHPWGQIGSKVVYKTDASTGKQVKHTYITGAALGGQMHYSIEVNDAADTLQRVAWIDYVANEYSPGSLVSANDGPTGTYENTWPGVVGRPYGGAAPTGNLKGDSKVAYVRGNKLFIRDIDGRGTAPAGVTFTTGLEAAALAQHQTPPPPPAVSSSLVYRADDEIYFGAGDGHVYKTNSAGRLDTMNNGVQKLSPGSDAIWYLNSASIVSADGKALMLMAQSKNRVNMLKYAGDVWSVAWWTGLKSDGTGESSASTVDTIPTVAADNAYISAASSITKAGVVIYVTTKPSACSINGYAFGPLKLDDGSSDISNSQFKLNSMTSNFNLIGDGDATGGTQVTINGKSGVLTGSAGTNTATGNTAAITRTGSSVPQRLNWREMTNFY